MINRTSLIIKQGITTPLLKQWLLGNEEEAIKRLLNLNSLFFDLSLEVRSVFKKTKGFTLDELSNMFRHAEESLETLPAFLHFIQKFNGLSLELRDCLYHKNWEWDDFEFQLAFKSLQDVYQRERRFAKMDATSLNHSSEKLWQMTHHSHELNVQTILAQHRESFLNKMRITETSAAKLNTEEKKAKKGLLAAKRILENEFGKTRSYKSIRELTQNEAGHLLMDLKPVWLMSPLSVSDTLLVNTSFFDIVIFDEASQITLQQGVPSLFRTTQTIIVGDEMQMPPATFFSTKSTSEDDEEAETSISIDAEGLLTQGANKLPSEMLQWHYRSRHESLIGFSNAAFYNRQLLTIPDRKIHRSKNENEAGSMPAHPIDVNTLLDKTISYIFLEDGIYHSRKNLAEANYIALLLSGFLKAKSGKTIGIVAFSQEQQGAIDAALEELASKDQEFEALLEAEYQRMEEDQFTGLFVKNLENVQGDERDVIIMSVCYGYNKQGKMHMNFGPINKRGGEKRLNVIFSRAKENMIVVSSIQPGDIKNDYNTGANYLKKFLRYALQVSNGQTTKVNTLLDNLSKTSIEKTGNQESAFLSQLKLALESKGLEVATHLGQSQFKCDLAVRKKNEQHYSLGILIDSQEHYSAENLFEIYCQKPEALRSFGWSVQRVYSKDWFDNPALVLRQIDGWLRE